MIVPNVLIVLLQNAIHTAKTSLVAVVNVVQSVNRSHVTATNASRLHATATNASRLHVTATNANHVHVNIIDASNM